MAYAAIMRRQAALHREWMIRSYVVRLAFVVFRVLADPLIAAEWLALTRSSAS